MPNRHRSLCLTPKLLHSAPLAFGAFLALLGCGSGEQTPSQGSAGASDEQAQVSSGVNVCPIFEGSLVMPQRINPGQSSAIVVRATDPDAPDSQLVFSWTAASGSFSASDKKTTSYRCEAPGMQRLTFTATDRVGCISTLNVDVECVAN